MATSGDFYLATTGDFLMATDRLVKATAGAIGGTLADQWRDFFTVPGDITPTSALFPAVSNGTNAGRGSNTKSSRAIISNGSKIVVPEGYGLLTFQDGGLTAFAAEPGGYIWDSDDLYSQSIFGGNDLYTSLVRQSWDRFKFGGRPGAQQLAMFVSLKELPNNKFGTQSEIYWDDAYLNAQIGVLTRGTYSLRIVDPILFVKEFVPATFLQGFEIFDFTDVTNAAASQLFSEVVASLASAFSLYTNDADKGNRVTRIQQDSIGFAASLAEAVEDAYQWRGTRGLTVSKATIVAIEYEESTKELLKTVQRADALSGTRGNVNLQASTASGIEAAGDSGGAGGLFGLGIAAGSLGLSDMMQKPGDGEGVGKDPEPPSASAVADPSDLFSRLEQLKQALDAGLITQEDFDAAKAKALGLA